MIQDDIPTLRACSLACKAMFASTRHLIHQTLLLTAQNNQSVLTREEKHHYLKSNNRHIELRFLSYLSERGLLRFTRKVHINMPRTFVPDTLLPHLNHFQSLDRVHSLTIEHYDITSWANHYKTCFVHFYPTLTSLTLSRPFNHYRLLLQFALQFPNLENLCLEWLVPEERIQADLPIPAHIDESPHLRGHLRLAGVDTVVKWPVDLANELPNGINFRSVELEGFFGSRAQHTLNACAHTLENLTIVPHETGTHQLSLAMMGRLTNFPSTGYLQLHNLKFTHIPVLRRLTLRIVFPQLSFLALELLPRAFSTITSPVFCELVLELSKLPSHLYGASSVYWRGWDRIDRFLEGRFADRKGFGLIIRTGKLHNQGTFERRTKDTFSLLESKGCVRFETCPSIEKSGC